MTGPKEVLFPLQRQFFVCLFTPNVPRAIPFFQEGVDGFFVQFGAVAGEVEPFTVRDTEHGKEQWNGRQLLDRCVPRLVQLRPTLCGRLVLSCKPVVDKGQDLLIVEVRHLHFGELLEHVLIRCDSTAQDKLAFAIPGLTLEGKN